MLHKFFEPGHWFEQKSHGYGAGFPVAWQGWVLLGSFTLTIIGLALLAMRAQSGGFAAAAGVIALMAVSTAIFIAIVHRRTRGGWRWRWGDGD